MTRRAAASFVKERPFFYWADLRLGLENVISHKLRSLLTMLGMIFGVAAVVSMLSIGAGAQRLMLTWIEQLGVRNLIVEAKEAVNDDSLQKVRQLSAGLSLQDLRVIRANVAQISLASPRKRFSPSKMLPKPTAQMPVIYGVDPAYQQIENLGIVEGRFFGAAEDRSAAPVCVLGTEARDSLFGSKPALGKYVKVNDQWFRVIGVAAPQVTLTTETPGLPQVDQNNLIYVPLYAALDRLEDTNSYLKDEIDGIYMRLQSGAESATVAGMVRGILDAAHRHAGDFNLIVPAELLAQQRRTQQLFEIVMVAIASISLLVGGIGIMNIMLASVLERTREIGIRRAVGARQSDIVRQFLIEATLISLAGGVIGILFGFGMSRLIALLAGWSTIVTTSSILLAFLVSVSVGLIFGTYPARKASRLDPVEAIRYE